MASESLSPASQFFDFSVINVRIDEAVGIITERIRCGEYAPVYFINAHCVNVAQRDLGYAASLRSNRVNFADGIGVAIAAWSFGNPLVDNVNGTDLFPPLCQALAADRAKVFLLGAQPGVAETLAQRMVENHPGLQIVGTQHGHFEDHESEGIADRIRLSNADVVFVAMGVPRQEHWIERYGSSTGAKVVLAVGGLFNFYSGKIPRAPRWMLRMRMEWVHRLYQEPRRMWRRYLVGNVEFLGRLAWVVAKKRRNRVVATALSSNAK